MDFEFPRGDTKRFKFKLKDSAGVDLKLSVGDKLYVTVKKNANSKDVLIQKTLESGIELNDDDGYYYVTFKADDTSDLDYGTYGFDIELKTSTGLVKILVIGSITLTEEYTYKGDE